MSKYVYTLTNEKNGKVYVGSSQCPAERHKAHLYLLKRGKHKEKELQKDFDKYGDCFRFEIVSKKLDDKAAHEKERALMVKLKTYDDKRGYNALDGWMNRARKENGMPYRKSGLKGKRRAKDGTFYNPAVTA